jgi:hypothetical protein
MNGMTSLSMTVSSKQDFRIKLSQIIELIANLCGLLAYQMGRTIPSFRMASTEEQKEWKEFRKALDKKDRTVFDGMFSICHLYNSACSFAAKPHPIIISVIFHHYKRIMKLKDELEKN